MDISPSFFQGLLWVVLRKWGGEEMYNRNKKGWVKHLDFMLIDTVCILAAYCLAYFIRHKRMFDVGSIYGGCTIALVLVHIFTTVFCDSYKDILKRGYFQELKQVIFHANWVWLGFVLIIYFFHYALIFSRTVFIIAWLFQIGLSYSAHLCWKKVLVKRFQDKEYKAVILVTESNLVHDVIHRVKQQENCSIKINGIIFVDKDKQGKYIDNIPVVANKDTMVEFLCRNWVDEVFIHFDENKKIPMELVEKCQEMGIAVHFGIIGINNIDDNNWICQAIVGYPVITYSIKMLTYRQVFFKGCVDIIGGLVGTLVAVILCITLGPIIYIKSPGPILFKQTRVGKNGKLFKIYKFRSMYIDAEERKQQLLKDNVYSNGMMFKMENDPRIIPGVGAFIRKHNLDEFPQFINVLKGEMSIVGTRPPTVDEWEKYKPKHRARMSTKPGITGAWQIAGKNKTIEFDDIVDMDVQYIKNWSFGLDLRLIFETVRIMFSGKTLESEKAAKVPGESNI